MINDNTIISSFNDRPTLLEWLKKVEEALKSDTATGVSVENPSANSYIFKITFADGKTIASDTILFPDSVKSVTIENGHIIVTTQAGIRTDLGIINPYADTIVSNSDTNTTEIRNNLQVNGTITAGGNVLTAVVANPTEDTTGTLSKIKIGNTAYAVGGGDNTLQVDMEFQTTTGGSSRFRCSASITDDIKAKLTNGEIKVISGSFKYENGSNGYYYVDFHRIDAITNGRIYEGVDILQMSNKIEKYSIEYFSNSNVLQLDVFQYALSAN